MTGPALEIGMGTMGLADVAATAQRFEELGFDYLTVGEHISFNLPTSSPLISLAAAAAVTDRIKLATTILLAPVYPAALLAKQTAVLDVISGGRLELGVGVGGENPAEIEACGVPNSQRGRRADEALRQLRKLWTEDRVSDDGTYATLRDITISPKPKQRPHPPVWVSGRSEAAMRRAARYGDGWMPYMFTPEQLVKSCQTVAECCAAVNRDPAAVRAGAFIFVSCHEDAAVARRRAVERMNAQYQQDFSALVDRYVATGDPEQVAGRLAGYVEAGATALFLGSGCADEHMFDNETLLATEVLPRLRKLAQA